MTRMPLLFEQNAVMQIYFNLLRDGFRIVGVNKTKVKNEYIIVMRQAERTRSVKLTPRRTIESE